MTLHSRNAAIVVAVALSAGCRTLSPRAPSGPPRSGHDVLARMADAYRGKWVSTLIEGRMRSGLWPNGRPEQTLRYEHVEVRMIGVASAMVAGQFVLSGAGRPLRTGWFTTVWTKTPAGWSMVHDHSG